MIDVKTISKRFGATVAVDNVSFGVEKGEILGFLGPNGAGKSTTMKILTTYLIPDDGTATVDGFDIIAQPLQVRTRIGYLPESVPLYNEMRVEEYLAFIAQARQIPAGERTRRVEEIIDRVGLRAVTKKNCGNLSKGFRQRVGVAQALIHDPPVLVLDEPTSGLDPQQIIEIRDLIRTIGEKKVVIFSTHILQEIEAICKRIIIINQGRIAANGTPAELARKVLGGIRFRGRVEGSAAEVKEALARLDGVREVHAEQRNGTAAFHAVFTKSEDPGLAFGRIAREKGWTVLEASNEQSSLEDVYLAITRTR
jgi:ABC-2 type transport system ATP-binding protein